MTQRRRNRHRKRRVGRRAFLDRTGRVCICRPDVLFAAFYPGRKQRGACAIATGCPQPRPAQRRVAGGVGELSRICRDGLFLRKRVPGRCRRADGQLPVPWAEHRHCTGAALRRCALPEQPLPVEPPVHRRAGAGPGIRPAGRAADRGPRPGAIAGGLGQPPTGSGARPPCPLLLQRTAC